MNIAATAAEMGITTKVVENAQAMGIETHNIPCAFNNPKSAENLKAAKMNRGMTKIQNFISRFEP